MLSRFTLIAMALAAPLLLAACEREAQQEAETGQAEEPQIAETQAPQPAEPTQPQSQPDQQPTTAEQQPPPAGEPSGQPAPEAQGGAGEGEEEVVVVPPQEEAAGGERQTAQAEDRQPAAQAPGEPSPEAAGVASVAAYVGRWAEEERMCQRSSWTFTNLRLQTHDGMECDIYSTKEREDGVSLEIGCTPQEEPLAEPERGTMSLTFPNLPQTDTMEVSGGPAAEEARTLARCPLG